MDNSVDDGLVPAVVGGTSARGGRKRQAALLRVARRSAAESDPEKVLHVLLSEAQHLLDATGGIVAGWDEERQVLVKSSSTIPNANQSDTLPLGHGVAGRAAAARQPVIVNDYLRLGDASPGLLRLGVKAAMAAPLLHEGRLLGAIVITSNQPHRRFTSDDADVLVIMAGMGASTLVALERNRTEHRLRLETERFEQLVETTSDAIIVTDHEMRLLAWNRGAEKLYGWDRDEVLGRPVPFLPADRVEETEQLWQRVLQHAETVANYEEVRVTKDGRHIPIMATISPMRVDSGKIVGVLGIAKDLSALKEVEEKQRLLARLEERECIAMDLHDNTVQSLHGAVLLLEAAERSRDSDVEQIRSAVSEVKRQLNSAIKELRKYLLDLRLRSAPRPSLTAGLLMLAKMPRVNGVTKVELEIDESVESLLPPEAVEPLLAIAREAVFNAIRHAQAHTLAIRLAHDEARVCLAISDDGRGFEREDSGSSGGQGLANMTERARALGARLTLVTHSGRGTDVRLEMPLAVRRSPNE